MSSRADVLLSPARPHNGPPWQARRHADESDDLRTQLGSQGARAPAEPSNASAAIAITLRLRAFGHRPLLARSL
ncbi:MAG TPA: hypothetical protein VKD28_11485 [Gemmatimonadales bacterium]|nr:hypothetical protein [Gemmatimonadales bacterium]